MSEDEILYHYTSIAGLNGIIHSRNVWASDCRYLNDQKELFHAVEMFLDRFKQDIKKTLSLALHWHNSSRAHCIFSLSRSPHVLSQWRAYGDDGRGTAIGFYRKYLPGIGKSSTHLIVECIYDDHNALIDSITKKYGEDIDAILNMHSESKGAVNSFWSLIDKNPEPLMRLYGELLKIKNPAFKEEQEVRLLISVPTRQVRTRVAKGLIVPYIEHSFVDGDEEHMWCVAPKIWLGPRCDKRNMQAIQVYGQFGWGPDSVQHYDCGYI